MTDDAVGLDDVVAAADRIRDHIHRTPVMTSAGLDRLSGASLFFKCENLQRTGVFKARGACNAVFGLPEEGIVNGVATHSSGNHAQALSYAARRREIEAIVVMPRDAPQCKKAAVIGYGGRIVECAPGNTSRERMLAQVVEESGAHVVHPYDDHRVIAGQGTCVLELLDQCVKLDAIIAPVGGGGLVSGACAVVAALSPEIAVYGAEPAQADDAHRSLRQGRIVRNENPGTIADGLRVNLMALTWRHVSRYVRDILLVEEAQIIRSMYLVWQRMKLVIEPSSAVPVAAVLAHRDRFRGKRVGIVLTGGNLDFDALPPSLPGGDG